MDEKYREEAGEGKTSERGEAAAKKSRERTTKERSRRIRQMRMKESKRTTLALGLRENTLQNGHI